MRIGYVPYSKSLLHPGDRRRLGMWAESKGIELELINPLNSDLLVLSNAANFGYWIKRATQPVVLDLVDGYLGESPSFFYDFLRNLLRTMRGTSSFHWITYTRHLKAACQSSSLVIVASEEQALFVKQYNQNVRVILDNHSELIMSKCFSESSPILQESFFVNPFILWEGFGYTLKHFEFMADELDEFLSSSNWRMCLVTVREFHRWGGILGKVKTESYIRKLFPKSHHQVAIVDWNLQNLSYVSAKATAAIIPITPFDKFANLKSENKLLSMWQLGLRTLVSDTPAYRRVMQLAGQDNDIISRNGWSDALAKLLADSREDPHSKLRRARYLSQAHSDSALVAKWDLALKVALAQTQK